MESIDIVLYQASSEFLHIEVRESIALSSLEVSCNLSLHLNAVIKYRLLSDNWISILAVTHNKSPGTL